MTQRVLKPLGLADSFFGAGVTRRLTVAVRYDFSGNPLPEAIAGSMNFTRRFSFTLQVWQPHSAGLPDV